MPSLKPTSGARPLLETLRSGGLTLIVATSAGEELSALLDRAGVADLVAATATSEDADRSKPDADIVEAALANAGVA